MIIPTERVLKRTLMLTIEGTRGGPVRLEVLLMLRRRPQNINEIATALSLDYKTVQHHIRVLEKSNLVTSSKRKYGNAYSLSTFLKAHKLVLQEILKKYGEK